MKNSSPLTLVFAVLAAIGAALAIHAYSTDSEAKPAATRVTSAPAAQPAPAVAAQPAPAAAERTVSTRPARARVRRRPAARFAMPTNRALAAQDCREESIDDAAEFRFTFGQGQAAVKRCTRVELAKQRADCRAEQVEDPFDYRAEYGSGRQGLTRCVRDALT